MINLACNYTLYVNDYLMCDKGEVRRFKLINLLLNLKEKGHLNGNLLGDEVPN